MRDCDFVDTNIFLRFFTADVPELSIRTKKLIDELARGSREMMTSDLVIAELVWVMESFYKLSAHDIVTKICFLVNLRGLKLMNKSLILEALEDYERHNIDYIDAYNAAFMKFHGISALYTYDRDYDKMGVRRLEP